MTRKHIESIVKPRFEKDTANHVMEVIRDDGVNRHIRFREPGTMCYHFDLITWPGYLCYTGDMGTFVFSRLTDMFEFFRTDSGRINLSYWSEKLRAQDCTGRHSGNSVETFDGERFNAIIREQRLEWIREAHRSGELDKDQRRELWEELDGLIYCGDEDESYAVRSACDFSWSADRYGSGTIYRFEDFHEHNIAEYTHHFVWCCLAIAWGIGVYDKAKAEKSANASVPALEAVQ